MESTPPERRIFAEEFVDVKIPQRDKAIDVVKRDIPKDMDMYPKEGFQPFRIVINLVVVDFDTHEIELTDFDPPIEVRVRYQSGDVDKAGAPEKLKLGFWDGKRWILCTVEKHRFSLQPDDPKRPAQGGWGVVFLKHWGDPTVSWGT